MHRVRSHFASSRGFFAVGQHEAASGGPGSWSSVEVCALCECTAPLPLPVCSDSFSQPEVTSCLQYRPSLHQTLLHLETAVVGTSQTTPKPLQLLERDPGDGPIPAGWGGIFRARELNCRRKAHHTARYVRRTLRRERRAFSFQSTSLLSLLTVQAAFRGH